MTKKKRNKGKKPQEPISKPPVVEEISDQHEKWLRYLLFTLVAAIYALTLKRTVEGGDSGELVATAYTWGIAHPPGYPLYTILGKLFSFLPFGSIAIRFNLFSAICNLLATYLLWQGTRILTGKKALALCVIPLYAFYPYVWRYSVVAEVFALNNLICAGLIYLSIDHLLRRNDLRNLYLGAFIIGLGVSHHHTIIFIAFPLVLCLIYASWQQLASLKVVAKLVGFGLLGLLPYLYMPIAASFQPANIWGDHTTFKGFWLHFIRDDYGTFSLATEGETRFIEMLFYYFYKNLANYAYISAVFFIAALLPWKNFLDKKSLFAFRSLLFALFFYVVVFHFLSNITQFLDPNEPLGPMYFEILLRFWLMPHLIFVIILTIGIAKICPKPSLQMATAFISAALLIGFNYQEEDQSQKNFVEKQGRETLDALPENALLLISGDNLTNSIRYLQFCEEYRKDVTVINRQMLKRHWMKPIINKNFPDVTIPGDHFGYEGYHFADLFTANISNRPIFISQIKETDAYEMQDNAWKETFELWPHIHVEKLRLRDGLALSASHKTEVKSKLPDLEELSSQKPKSPEGSWEVIAWRSFWEVHHNFARRIIVDAMAKNNDRALLEEGIQILERVIKTIDKPKPQYYKDLGLAYSKMTLYDSKYNQMTKDMWVKYLENPIRGDKDNSEIAKIINNL